MDCTRAPHSYLVFSSQSVLEHYRSFTTFVLILCFYQPHCTRALQILHHIRICVINSKSVLEHHRSLTAFIFVYFSSQSVLEHHRSFTVFVSVLAANCTRAPQIFHHICICFFSSQTILEHHRYFITFVSVFLAAKLY